MNPSDDAAPDVAALVEGLLESVERVLLTSASPGEAPPLRPLRSASERLARVAEHLPQLSPSARSVMQGVLAEISGQLAQIQLLTRELKARARHSEAAALAAEADVRQYRHALLRQQNPG